MDLPAIGERQIFPKQTNRTEICFTWDPEDDCAAVSSAMTEISSPIDQS